MKKSYLCRETKRLIVRPLEARDYKAWMTAHTTMLPAKNTWDHGGKKLEDASREKFAAILKSQGSLRKEDKFYDLAVFERKTGRLVGTVSVMDVLRGLGQTAFIGYRIFNRDWNKGFGKEATAALIDIAFRDVKVHRVEAGIEPQNRRSLLLARSLGLRKEGLKKRAIYLRKTWVDIVMYSATCEEFGFKWKAVPATRPR